MAWMREPIRVPKFISNFIPAVSQPALSANTSPSATTAPEASPAAGEVTAEIVLSHLRNGSAHLVDAREDHEWVEGHLRGAIHIPASKIYEHIEKLYQQVPKNEKVIV